MRNLWDFLAGLKLVADPADSKQPKIEPPRAPAAAELPKARRPLTDGERQQLRDKIERAKKTDPNIYPLW